MSFDRDSNLPIINPHKRTTKVNFAIVAGVLLFLALSTVVLLWFNAHPEHAVPATEQPAR